MAKARAKEKENRGAEDKIGNFLNFQICTNINASELKSYVKMRERQKEDRFILISDETVTHETSYSEKIYTLKPGQEKPDKNSEFVEVISYITYDENDLMRIDNYRLKEVK